MTTKQTTITFASIDAPAVNNIKYQVFKKDCAPDLHFLQVERNIPPPAVNSAGAFPPIAVTQELPDGAYDCIAQAQDANGNAVGAPAKWAITVAGQPIPVAP